MTSLSDVIADVLRDMDTAPQPRRPVATDEQVADCIRRIGTMGYRPSPIIVEPVRDYLSGYGLLMTGPAGVGKTFLMQCLGVRIQTAQRITEHGFREIADWYDWNDGTELCIDDVGVESVTVEFGQRDDLLKSVIAHRAERQKGRTHITTNLTSEQIVERYGDRTLSRIVGMCRPHRMNGPHMRGEG